MALQIRTILPDGVSGEEYAAEIGRMLNDAAQMILGGGAGAHYEAAVARYQTLLELMNFAEERVEAQRKGDEPVNG